MRRLTLFSSALLAALAFSAAFTTGAFALVVQLPSEGSARTFTGENDGTNPIFESTKGTKIECTGAKGEGTEEANGKPLGLFHIHFTGCKGESPSFPGVKAPCTGLGDEKEQVLVLGTWHLWYDVLTPELGVATVFLIEPEVHFECTFLVVQLYKVKGNVVCLDLKPTEPSTDHLFHCLQEKGKSKDPKYWDEGGVERTAKLETLENDKEPWVESAELALGLVKSTVSTFADNV